MNTKNQIRIFIVDDNKVFTIALEADIIAAFADIPIKVYPFETGEACMRKFKEVNPQVVILDYHLNSKDENAEDGIKVLDEIKKINNETYVILLTYDDNIDIALRSFKHGASDYIVKSDTQLRKIIFSLFNLFKIMEAKIELKRYKRIAIITIIGISLVIGAIIAIHIFSPSTLTSNSLN